MVMSIMTKTLNLKSVIVREYQNYKNIFATGYTPNWPAEVIVIKEIKNNVQWTHVISDLNNEEIVGTFCEKELQKINQTELRVKKVAKKGDRLYVKWKSYDNFSNSWINMKDIV